MVYYTTFEYIIIRGLRPTFTAHHMKLRIEMTEDETKTKKSILVGALVIDIKILNGPQSSWRLL